MYRVPPDLLVRSKTAEPLYVRHIAMFVAWRHFGHSLGGIGRGFSRDRTTVRHAVRKIEAALAEDPAIRRDVTLLESYLRSAS
jgi:chromosomal replication initiator protein